MSVLVILIFTMTFRIFAGEQATLNDSVSTNVDSKRPHIILQFNFSKDIYSQQRISRYDINRTNKTRNEAPKVAKASVQASPVFSEDFPIKPSQLLGTDETKRIWRRKRLRKRLKTFPKHVSNDLVLLGVNATQVKDVKPGQAFDKFSEEGPQSSRKFKDRMNVLFFKERTQNPNEKELNSSTTFRPIRILQTQRNRSSSRQLLQHHEFSLRKAQRNILIFRRSVGLKILQPVGQDVQSLAMQLFAKWRTSIKGKSVRYYKKFHDRLRAAFNRISEHDETLKQNNTITLLSLLNRSKRHTKSRNLKAPREETEEKAKTKSTEEKKQQTRKKAKPAKPTDNEELNEDDTTTTADPNEKHHKNFMQVFVNRLFDDVKDSKHDGDQQKKLTAETEDPLDVKIKEFNQFRTEISRAVEVEATSITSPRALNGSEEAEQEPDRFSAAKQVPQPPRIVFYFRKTTTKEPEVYDATYAILIGLGVCIAILLCAICIVLCVNKSSAKPKEQEPLIIFTARPTEEQMFDDIDRQNERRERRMRRRLARESYIQLHAAPTWPLDQHTGHAVQPRSESPRQIQSAVVAPLNENTVAPVSPVPVPASPSKVELPTAAPASALKPQGK